MILRVAQWRNTGTGAVPQHPSLVNLPLWFESVPPLHSRVPISTCTCTQGGIGGTEYLNYVQK